MPALTHPIPHRSIPAWAGETASLSQREFVNMVYPRVGGGNLYSRPHPRASYGLSPRGRGKPLAPRAPVRCAGSIPAWAGETPLGACVCAGEKVYPRVGGGNRLAPCRRSKPSGLSPRGRGKLPRMAWASSGAWSIPAWAGETRSRSAAASVTMVYPRVGGGNRSHYADLYARRGLSPRGRGKRGGA